MIGFKHISKEFADDFASGDKISVGLFRYYREIEGDRRDPLEGVTLAVQNEDFGWQGNEDRLIPTEFFPPWFIAAGATAKNFFISGSAFASELPDYYLFCCSDRADVARSQRGEAVFQIGGLKTFARMMSDANPHLLGRPLVRRVRYAPRISELFKEQLLEPDYFVKDSKYAHEREIRIIWRKVGNGRQQELLRCLPAKELFRRWDRMVGSGPA